MDQLLIKDTLKCSYISTILIPSYSTVAIWKENVTLISQWFDISHLAILLPPPPPTPHAATIAHVYHLQVWNVLSPLYI